MRRSLSIVFLIVFSAGCASVQVSEKFNGMELDGSQRAVHISGVTWGLYLFSTFPVFVPRDSGGVSLDAAMNMVTSKARDVGAIRIVDLESQRVSKWIPHTLVFWYKEVQVSANAVRE